MGKASLSNLGVNAYHWCYIHGWPKLPEHWQSSKDPSPSDRMTQLWSSAGYPNWHSPLKVFPNYVRPLALKLYFLLPQLLIAMDSS